ncbi:hypothetical protein STEG23_003923 [Scotinomys teguina]
MDAASGGPTEIRVKVEEQLAELEKEEQERETVASLHEEEREADKNLARSGDLEESDSALGEVKDLDLEDEEERLESEIRGLRKKLKNLHSPTGILMQREDVILEWIFLPCKPNKKLKTYIEKISDLIHKGEEKLWIPTKLIKIRFEQEKPLDKEK